MASQGRGTFFSRRGWVCLPHVSKVEWALFNFGLLFISSLNNTNKCKPGRDESGLERFNIVPFQDANAHPNGEAKNGVKTLWGGGIWFLSQAAFVSVLL